MYVYLLESEEWNYIRFMRDVWGYIYIYTMFEMAGSSTATDIRKPSYICIYAYIYIYVYTYIFTRIKFVELHSLRGKYAGDIFTYLMVPHGGLQHYVQHSNTCINIYIYIHIYMYTCIYVYMYVFIGIRFDWDEIRKIPFDLWRICEEMYLHTSCGYIYIHPVFHMGYIYCAVTQCTYILCFTYTYILCFTWDVLTHAATHIHIDAYCNTYTYIVCIHPVFHMRCIYKYLVFHMAASMVRST